VLHPQTGAVSQEDSPRLRLSLVTMISTASYHPTSCTSFKRQCSNRFGYALVHLQQLHLVSQRDSTVKIWPTHAPTALCVPHPSATRRARHGFSASFGRVVWSGGYRHRQAGAQNLSPLEDARATVFCGPHTNLYANYSLVF